MLRTPSPIRACRTRPRPSAPVEPPPPVRPILPYADACIAFLLDQQLAGRRPLTCKRHRQELRQLGRYLDQEHIAWSAISEPELRAYLRTRVGLSLSSQANLISTLRVFYDWARGLGLVAVSPAIELPAPPRDKSIPRALKRVQVRQLLAYLAAQERVASRRDEMLILTAIYTGLRRRELAELDWSAVDLAERTITIFVSKMNRGRVITVHVALAALLAKWCIMQGRDGVGPVFDWEGEALSADRVGKIMKRTSERTGVEFAPHVLRHTFATWAYREGRDINSVSKALGHQELRQTMIYVAADPEDSRVAVESLPGPDAW